MGVGSTLNNPCKCGSGKKYKKCCYGKTEKRKCPVCEGTNEIPADAVTFTCQHCSTNLIKTNKPLLTEVFTTKDEIDQEIYRKIMINFGSQLSNDGMVFSQNKADREAFTGCILEILQSLSKANSCRRKYVETEKEEIKNLYERNSGKTFVGAVIPVDLNTQLDGALVHIKAAMDSLAKTTKPLFGFKHENWAKKQNKSGLRILNSLKDISRTPDENLKKLIKFVEDNIEWISFLVNLRDNPVHYGRTLASNLIYSEHTKKVTPQLIIHTKGKELVGSFLERSIKEITEFIHIFLKLSFNVKAIHGAIVMLDDKGDAFWHIPELTEFIRTEKEKEKDNEQYI